MMHTITFPELNVSPTSARRPALDQLLFNIAARCSSGRRHRIYGRLAKGRTWQILPGVRVILDQPLEAMQYLTVINGVYEPEIAALLWCLLQPNAVFLDIGANAGLHSLVAASRGAVVHAFEPLPRVRERLNRNVNLNKFHSRILIHPYALGKKRETLPLYVADRWDDGSHSLAAPAPASRISVVEVSVVDLDELVYTGKIAFPALIKIDVEGFESQVLDGSRAVLHDERAPLVIIETADRMASEIGESAQSALKRLLEAQYRIFKITDCHALVPVLLEQVSGDLANYLAIPERRLEAVFAKFD